VFIAAFTQPYKTKNPLIFRLKGFANSIKADKIWHRPTLPHFTAVPSALAGLTSLFGMGRGGHRRYRHLNFFLLRLKVEGLKLKGLPFAFVLLPFGLNNDILLKEVIE